ncbi:hypothetical protein IG631_20452 [Alternaria alternata]|nr:hypothetical protein IG631_20452 [Alternaria alternata]
MCIPVSSASCIVDSIAKLYDRWSDVSEVRLRLPMTTHTRMREESVLTPTISAESNTEVAQLSLMVTPSCASLQHAVLTCQTRCRIPRRVSDLCYVCQLPMILFKFCFNIKI